ncbi:unnamed protein product, partial [Ectocarpus sp. 8 AP-2014]
TASSEGHTTVCVPLFLFCEASAQPPPRHTINDVMIMPRRGNLSLPIACHPWPHFLHIYFLSTQPHLFGNTAARMITRAPPPPPPHHFPPAPHSVPRLAKPVPV